MYEQFIIKKLKEEPEKFIDSDFFTRPFLTYIRKSA